MKHLLALIFLVLSAQQALACDAAIEKFSRDCWMQDRLANLRQTYAAQGINIDEIGEYKVLRFIDRTSWVKATTGFRKTAPLEIYDPAPATWRVWAGGIDKIFNSYENKNALFNNLTLDQNTFSKINTVLLTDGTTSIKDKITDQSKKPGEFRVNNDGIVGFCGSKYDEHKIRRSEEAMDNYLRRWESSMGQSFSDIVAANNGPDALLANMRSDMVMGNSCGSGGQFVKYSPTRTVMNQVEWISIFIKANLDSYRNGRAVISPVELAAVVQKWFVSVHPFADGNGRTSRGVQEIIMANFGLPFIPSGDLQNDALEHVDTYIKNTYDKLDAMLTQLEMCVTERTKSKVPRICRTVQELNEKSGEYNNQLDNRP